MIEKMKFDKKENLKFLVRRSIVFICYLVEMVLCVRYRCIHYTKLGYILSTFFILISMIFFYRMDTALTRFFKEKRDKNIAEFEYKMKIDDFLEFLGNREIELKLKLELDVPMGFEEAILNPNLKYYARKEGLESLFVCARSKNGDEVWHCTIKNDDKFFFQYFEPYVR